MDKKKLYYFWLSDNQIEKSGYLIRIRRRDPLANFSPYDCQKTIVNVCSQVGGKHYKKEIFEGDFSIYSDELICLPQIFLTADSLKQAVATEHDYCSDCLFERLKKILGDKK